MRTLFPKFLNELNLTAQGCSLEDNRIERHVPQASRATTAGRMTTTRRGPRRQLVEGVAGINNMVVLNWIERSQICDINKFMSPSKSAFVLFI